MTTGALLVGLACGVVAALLFTWNWVHQAAEDRRRGFSDARFEPMDSILVFAVGVAVFLLVQLWFLGWEMSQNGTC